MGRQNFKIHFCIQSINTQKWSIELPQFFYEHMEYFIEYHIYANHSFMSLSMYQKIKLPKYQGITRIITDCDELSRSISSCKMSYELPKLKRYLVNPEQTEAEDATANYLQIKSKKQSTLAASYSEYDPNKPINLPADRKHRKTKFRAEIIISKQNKPTFSRIVHKFKKSFHPANASKSDNITSQRQGRKQLQRPHQPKQSFKQRESRQEMKRLIILSQVIAENTRRQILSRREKFNSRRISM